MVLAMSGALDELSPTGIDYKTCLVPRPFEGRRKGLVHTVCVCTKFTEIFLKSV